MLLLSEARLTIRPQICSDRNKPDGQWTIPPEVPAILNFVGELPIRKVSGIGKV